MNSRCVSLCLPLVAAACLVGLSPVSASTLFDFSPGSGDFPFTAPGGFVNSGQASFDQTESGITLTAAADGGLGTIGVANNPHVAPTTVGIGVAGGGGAALQSGESITVTFDTDVLLEEIVLDGHAPPEMAGIALPGFSFSLQQASTINGSAPPGTSFSGAGGATVDDTLTFGTPFALSTGQSIVFTLANPMGGYFVRSVTVDVIPEPASIALLALGSLTIYSMRRTMV